jgi:NADPH:quinone reductase-like Zn-dependent oxidoreductase
MTSLLPDCMQAVVISRPGGPEVLKVTTLSLPKLAAGEVLIKIAAAGVNRPDCLQRAGLYPPPPGDSGLPRAPVDHRAFGRQRGEVDCGEILRRRLIISGSTLRARSVEFKSKVAATLRQKVWPLLEAKKIRPVIFKVFPLQDAAKAHALMESGGHVGKIVLEVGESG